MTAEEINYKVKKLFEDYYSSPSIIYCPAEIDKIMNELEFCFDLLMEKLR